MAHRTNWLREWKVYTWKGLTTGEIKTKKDKIKSKVKAYLKKWDEEHPKGKKHTVTFFWSKLTAGDRLVAHLTPPETENSHGGVPPVLTPNTPPQPS